MRRITGSVRGIAAVTALLAAGTAMAAPNPSSREDGEWMSVHGKVTSTTDTTFMLDYGGDTMMIEMDDWDQYGDALPLDQGDQVTVYGRVDDTLLEQAKLEASSVYVEEAKTTFYASSTDEEELDGWLFDSDANIGDTTYRGNVTSVSPSADQFKMKSGKEQLTVLTSAMTYDPLDDQGYQQIEKDDRVLVQGILDEKLFNNGKLTADSVVTLSD